MSALALSGTPLKIPAAYPTKELNMSPWIIAPTSRLGVSNVGKPNSTNARFEVGCNRSRPNGGRNLPTRNLIASDKSSPT